MRYADSHEIIIEKEPFHTAYAHNKEEQINNESEYRIADSLMLAINILLVAAGIIYSKKKDFI